MNTTILIRKTSLALALSAVVFGAQATEFSQAELRSGDNFIFQVPVIGLNASESQPQIFLDVKTENAVSRSLSHRVFLSESKASALVRVSSVAPKGGDTVTFTLTVRDSEGQYRRAFTVDGQGKITEGKTLVQLNKEIADKRLAEEQDRLTRIKEKAEAGKVDFYDFKPVSIDVVKPGQTLRQMSLPYSRKSAAQTKLPTVSQTMAALYMFNQHAFKDGDVSKLMVDYALRVPDAKTIMKIPHGEAREFLKKATAGKTQPALLSKFTDGMKSRLKQQVAEVKAADASGTYKPVEENKPTGPLQYAEEQATEIRLVNQTEEPDYSAEDELAQKLGINREKDEFLNKNADDVKAMKEVIAQVGDTLGQGVRVLNIRANSDVDLLSEVGSARGDVTPVYVEQAQQTYGPSYAEDEEAQARAAEKAKADYEQGLKDEIKDYEIVQAEDQVTKAYGEKIDAPEPVTLDSLESEVEQSLTEEISSLGFSGVMNKYGAYVYSLLALISLGFIGLMLLLLKKKKAKSTTVGQEIGFGMDKDANINPHHATAVATAAAKAATQAGFGGVAKREPIFDAETDDSDGIEEEAFEDDEESFSQVDRQKVEEAPVKGLKDRYSQDKAVINREAMEYGFDPEPIRVDEDEALVVAQAPVTQKQAAAVQAKPVARTQAVMVEQGDFAEISATDFREAEKQAEQQAQEKGFTGAQARKMERKPEVKKPRAEMPIVDDIDSDEPINTNGIDFGAFEGLDEKLDSMAKFKEGEIYDEVADRVIDTNAHMGDFMNPDEIQPRKPIDQTLTEDEIRAQAREIRELMGEDVSDLIGEDEPQAPVSRKLELPKAEIPAPSQNDDIDFGAFDGLDDKLDSMAKFKEGEIYDEYADEVTQTAPEAIETKAEDAVQSEAVDEGEYDDHLIVDPIPPAPAENRAESAPVPTIAPTDAPTEVPIQAPAAKAAMPELNFDNAERDNKATRAQEVASESRADKELKKLSGDVVEEDMTEEQLEIETMLELVDAYVQMEDTDSAGKLLISSIKGKTLTASQKARVKEVITLIRERV